MDSLEALKKAKIPGPETGIEKKNTVCAICSPAYNCGVSAYVKDGKIVDHFDIDKNDLSKEEDFNAWVDKYELNKDIDYSKETK